MSFSELLASTQAQAEKLGLRESRIGFVFRHDDRDMVADCPIAPLSDVYCVALKNSATRKYKKDGIARMPNMVAVNRGHWFKGQAIWGCPEWHESKRQPGVYFANSGKDLRPEGNLRDLQEPDDERPVAFDRKRGWDHTILRWTARLFEEELIMQRSGQLFPQIVTPQLLCQLPSATSTNWLQLRQSWDLDQLVERVVNLKRYNLHGVKDLLCAAANGTASRYEKGAVIEEECKKSIDLRGDDYIMVIYEKDGDHTQQILRNPQDHLQTIVHQTFGVPIKVDLFPLMPEGTTEVACVQALYTPLQDQVKNPRRQWSIAELKKLPVFPLLQYVAVLSAAVEFDGKSYIDCDFAFADKESTIYVHMGGDFPRVQRITSDPAAFKVEGVSFKLDMLDVPQRAAIQRNKERHARLRREEEERKKRGVVQPKTAEEVVAAAATPVSAGEKKEEETLGSWSAEMIS